MNKECNIVQDLIPLYVEKTASKESADFIEKHCETCEKCKKVLELSKNSIIKNEKEQDEKMQKIWANLERQEKAKSKRKWTFRGICGILVILFLLFYGCCSLQGNTWFVRTGYLEMDSESANYYSPFSLFSPQQKDLIDAQNAVKDYFKLNYRGCFLAKLTYNEIKTYDENFGKIYPNNRSIVFFGTISYFPDAFGFFTDDTDTTYKWIVSYDYELDHWIVTSSTHAVTEG